MESKTIEHPVIGEVEVSRSLRARRVSVSVRPPGRVRLTVPRGVGVADALRFLDSRAEWVEAAKVRVAARVGVDEVIGMPYRTRGYELRLFPAETDAISMRIAGGEIRVTFPVGLNYASAEVQGAIRRGIESAWRAEAREMLPGRVDELARRHGLQYRSVSVRNARTRWGSCSARNDISLSIRLMRLPDDLIDYIILHELCHTVHKNHGPRFHALLDSLTGGCHRVLRRRMLQYR